MAEAEPATGKSKKTVNTAERRIKMLEQELAETKEYLQRNIEEQDAYTEELKSANEEIQSSNEELQSTNEELETAKEEMQSINEELTTLNDELQVRNSELSQVNNDLSNLLANVNFTVVMVGMDLRIRRFNPKAAVTLNLIPTDAGRPIGDINPNVRIENIEKKLKEVIDSLRVHEEQVKDKSGHWYSLSIRPYKTAENKIDGAVLLMVDSDQAKYALNEAEQDGIARGVLEAATGPMLLLNSDLQIEIANRRFADAFKIQPSEIEGQRLFEIKNRYFERPELHKLIEGTLGDSEEEHEARLAQNLTTDESPNGAIIARARSLEGKRGRVILTLQVEG